MEKLSVGISLLSGLSYLLGFLYYNWGLLQGKIKPNGATWAIWTALAIMSAGSYFLTSQDFWKSIIPIINTFLCIGTFIVALVIKKFQKIDTIDWVALIIGLIAAAVWGLSLSAVSANIIVQIAIFIGFIPLWRTLWHYPDSERALPWCLWTFSYFATGCVVVLRWHGVWAEIIYPMNCFLLHISVPLISFVRRRYIKPSN